jgi:hypothetical protein
MTAQKVEKVEDNQDESRQEKAVADKSSKPRKGKK